MPFTIKTPHPTSLLETVRSHGWVELAPWEWDENAGWLSRPELLDGVPHRIGVRQTAPSTLEVTVADGLENSATRKQARCLVARWLSLDWNPHPLEGVAGAHSPGTADFVREGGGRLLRGSTFYEDLVKTLCTVNASWSFSRQMTERLVSEIGEGVFPQPGSVLSAGEAVLKNRVRMGYRAPVLCNLTRTLLERWGMDDAGQLDAENISFQDLLSLKGIGPYAAAHMRVLLHDFSRIPIDSSVTSYCQEALLLAQKDITPYFQSWAPFQFLGYKIGRRFRRLNTVKA